MRVAYNAILLGNYFSGVEITISTLAAMLAREMGDDLHIFLNSRGKDYFSFPDASCHYVDLPCNCRLSRIAWEHFVLPGQVRNLGCDLLHCPGYIAPYRASCPTVVTIHDAIALLQPKLCKITNQLYYRALMGRSVRQAAQVIVPSIVVKEQLVKLFGISPGKINVVPFAPASAFKKVDDAVLLAKVREKYGLPEKFVLSLCNHEPKKNIAGVIRAFAAFKDKVDGYKLVLAGRNAWGADEQAGIIRELDLAGDVILPGFIPFADLPAVYSLAGVFLFPSLDEGFGIPVLEAMSCGTPVVCSDRGALPETTAGAAVCVPPDDMGGMAEALANFAENTGMRSDFIEKGIKRTRELSWEKTTRATLEVYRKALG
ncbi:MAG: glycosyltransferase family 1 protein [Victivallales bacterium]